jgi:hypothetical protein
MGSEVQRFAGLSVFAVNASCSARFAAMTLSPSQNYSL